jgi:hypothetical protein
VTLQVGAPHSPGHSVIRSAADAARLADSAKRRVLYRYAIPIYRYAADAGENAERATGIEPA